MKTLHIRHQFRNLGAYYVTTFFDQLYKALMEKYQNTYIFEISNNPEYENYGYGSIYSCMNFSIINPESEKYILISFFDNWKYHFMHHLGWRPSKMISFFYPGGFNYLDYFNFKLNEYNNLDIECPTNIDQIYQSFYYNTYEHQDSAIIDDVYENRDINNTIEKLYFKGHMWDFRKEMIKFINNESICVMNRYDEQNLHYLPYLKELAQYRCALSLPGGTEVCNRDIECFAIGVPVIRPCLNIHYPEPLIPNYHYISCYSDCKYWDGNPFYLSYKDLGDSIEYYWNKVKNNIEYLNFISHNARLWYSKYCTLNSNIHYLLPQLKLEELTDG